MSLQFWNKLSIENNISMNNINILNKNDKSILLSLDQSDNLEKINEMFMDKNTPYNQEMLDISKESGLRSFLIINFSDKKFNKESVIYFSVNSDNEIIDSNNLAGKSLPDEAIFSLIDGYNFIALNDDEKYNLMTNIKNPEYAYIFALKNNLEDFFDDYVATKDLDFIPDLEFYSDNAIELADYPIFDKEKYISYMSKIISKIENIEQEDSYLVSKNKVAQDFIKTVCGVCQDIELVKSFSELKPVILHMSCNPEVRNRLETKLENKLKK